MKLKNDTQSIYTPNAGTLSSDEIVYCGVCGDKTEAEFDVYGPRSWIQSIRGSKYYYDYYFCPNIKEKWHKQVVDLRKEKKNTASSVIKDILEEEINTILEYRKSMEK